MATTFKYLIFLLTTCVFFSGFAQSGLFLKQFVPLPGYTNVGMGIPHLDTLSFNSFITGGPISRATTLLNDTLVFDSYLQKTEISGLTKWHFNYHLNGYDLKFLDVKTTKNKKILISAQTHIYGGGNPSKKHGLLLLADSNGYVQLSRIYYSQPIYKLLLMRDSSIAVISGDSNGFFGITNLKIALLDHNLNLKWCQRIYPYTNKSNVFGLVEGKNKSILLHGSDFAILVDSSGNKINDFTLTSNLLSSAIYNAINYYDNGFYIVGDGAGTAITGCIIRTDDSLNIIWHKLLQNQNNDSEFSAISIIGRNNLVVATRTFGYGITSQIDRSGLIFIDSNAVARKSFLFTPDSIPIMPWEINMVRGGNILVSLFNPWSSYFGITDTSSNGFCNYTPINFVNLNSTQTFSFNNFYFLPGTFAFSNTSIHMYLPFTFKMEYGCSTGPSGPLDPLNPPVYTRNSKVQNSSTEIAVSPIPASDYLNIKFKSTNDHRNAPIINICNSNGELLYENALHSIDGSATININFLLNGFYVLFYRDETGTIWKQKFVVNR